MKITQHRREWWQICFCFWMTFILVQLIMMPTPPVRHPSKTTVIERGECKCPGGYMCHWCQEHPKDVCRCEPSKADYEEADRRYRAVQQQFAPVINSLNNTP